MNIINAHRCPACFARHREKPFYEVSAMPVNQVKLVRTREEALNCLRGDISLRCCPGCGFIWNAAFDPALPVYDEDYESTQAVSPTFNAFHERLARDLIQRFDLRGRLVVELGCGQGEFVKMLARLGPNECYGFDTVVRQPGNREGVLLIKDRYDDYSQLDPDFVCCKMTLEHIHDVGDFLRHLRRTVGDRPECVVFFMIPEVTRILKLRAFWDIYYEHCSYWSPGSLARAFRKAGFDPIDVWTDYDDQYVCIAARPSSDNGPLLPLLAGEEEPAEVYALVEKFHSQITSDVLGWLRQLMTYTVEDRRIVLWGGGSKGVAFLSRLGIPTHALRYAVDINPRRHSMFIAGTGQEIVTPDFLREYQPDVVIVMSPIYLPEIRAQLEGMGLAPRVISVEDGPPQ